MNVYHDNIKSIATQAIANGESADDRWSKYADSHRDGDDQKAMYHSAIAREMELVIARS